MSSIKYPIMNAEVLQAAFGFGEEGGLQLDEFLKL